VAPVRHNGQGTLKIIVLPNMPTISNGQYKVEKLKFEIMKVHGKKHQHITISKITA